MKKYFWLALVVFLAAGLRFYHLGLNPPSIYWEEAAIGYDAYSILKTGKDFHGNRLPLVAFESFGDYKPSLYFYTTVPSVALFGLNAFAVRAPSALFGTLTVLLIYFLVQELFHSRSGVAPLATRNPKLVALLASLLLATSPWHLQLSRAGFEANLGLFLVVLGAWLFLKGTSHARYLWLAVLTWGLSFYAYHADRVFIPLLGLVWGLWFFTSLVKKPKAVLAAAGLFILIVLPVSLRLNSPQVKLRFQQTSAFASLAPIIKSNQLIAEDGGGLVARLVHHRFWHYGQIFLKNYSDHYSGEFLFLSGDTNPRHSIQLVGGLYLIQLPLILLGAAWLFRRERSAFWLLTLWLILAPVPAGLTLATPHALRSLPLLIPLQIFSAYGVVSLFKNRRWLASLATLFLILEFGRYLYLCHTVYPRLYSDQWQYGYRQAVEFVSSRQVDYDHIYFTRELGRPSIYYWFYTKTDPQLVQAENDQAAKDQGEFLNFGKIVFGPPPENPPTGSLIVVGGKDSAPAFATLLTTIFDLDSKPVFAIYEI